MTEFLVNIWAYDHHAKFKVKCEDSSTSLENAILDKLGEKSIVWEYLGISYDNKINRITYEEVMDEKMMQHLNDLYKQKRGLDLQWEQEHLKEGRYTLDMVKIDRQVRDVLSHIKMAEAQREHLRNKVEDSAPQVSVAT